MKTPLSIRDLDYLLLPVLLLATSAPPLLFSMAPIPLAHSLSLSIWETVYHIETEMSTKKIWKLVEKNAKVNEPFVEKKDDSVAKEISFTFSPLQDTHRIKHIVTK